jgi:hypothetical protein
MFLYYKFNMDKTSRKKSGTFCPIVKNKLGTDCPSLRRCYVTGSVRPWDASSDGSFCPWDTLLCPGYVSSWDALSRDLSFGDASSGYPLIHQIIFSM